MPQSQQETTVSAPGSSCLTELSMPPHRPAGGSTVTVTQTAGHSALRKASSAWRGEAVLRHQLQPRSERNQVKLKAVSVAGAAEAGPAVTGSRAHAETQERGPGSLAPPWVGGLYSRVGSWMSNCISRTPAAPSRAVSSHSHLQPLAPISGATSANSPATATLFFWRRYLSSAGAGYG